MQTPRFLSSLNALDNVRASFTGRIPGVEGSTDRQRVVESLQPAHLRAVQALGFDWSELHLAEQVHGGDVAIVSKSDPSRIRPSVDALITADEGVLLGIYVADCGAVYIVDPVRGVLALVHSGKKGTEADITGNTIEAMREYYGSDPSDLHLALSPCIRPPAYEVDFAAEIRAQALAAGVPKAQFVDSGICTATELDSYYSYRAEKAKTGRMLALLGRR